MKTKGEQISIATEGRECVWGHTPVVTGSMRNRLRAQGIEALRGAYDGGGERGRRQRSRQGDMPPGCFARRVCKLLKRKGGARKKSAKSEKECATVCRERIYVGRVAQASS